MYMTTHYIQNIVPKKRARDCANMCFTDNKFNADTNCSNVKDLLKFKIYQLVTWSSV
jgi:hypothetical protein